MDVNVDNIYHPYVFKVLQFSLSSQSLCRSVSSNWYLSTTFQKTEQV